MQNEQKTPKTPKAVVAVVVRTYYPDGTTQSARLIDHNYKPHREWLGKHCYWAMREGLAVATAPVQKGEPGHSEIMRQLAAVIARDAPTVLHMEFVTTNAVKDA